MKISLEHILVAMALLAMLVGIVAVNIVYEDELQAAQVSYVTVESAYIHDIEMGSPPQFKDMVFTDKGNFYCSRNRTFELRIHETYNLDVADQTIYFVEECK